ncbi:MAG: sigma-54 interaction domain-containing protein [Candidatus Binataceae bacterium]
MTALHDAAIRSANGTATVLLTGESGTGKDVLARQIHSWSLRRGGPFVVVNCTAISDQLLDNELFGHVRGGFTGAVADKPGRLESAEGGTVFFDEIAELTSPLQARFLRFIQERSFERIGSNRTVTVDVRIIAASSRDLEAEVTAGRFREDLYYRLNVIMLRLPPLRERTQDILPLTQWMLGRMPRTLGNSKLALTPEAAEALVNYRWPGNIRELRNTLERAVTLACSETINRNDLPDSIRRTVSVSGSHTSGFQLRDREREYVLRVLSESSTLEQAAATLGINVTTLWRKRKRWGIG